jgi:hypothetical protein
MEECGDRTQMPSLPAKVNRGIIHEQENGGKF